MFSNVLTEESNISNVIKKFAAFNKTFLFFSFILYGGSEENMRTCTLYVQFVYVKMFYFVLMRTDGTFLEIFFA